jgi:hypothetical protein
MAEVWTLINSNDFPTFDLNFKDSYEKNSVFYVTTTIGYESY